MNTLPASTDHVTTTTGAIAGWVNTPGAVALIFALAGAVFLGVYILRRIRGEVPKN